MRERGERDERDDIERICVREMIDREERGRERER